MMVDPLAVRRSRRLGRYELVKHVASGGMAEVFLAKLSGVENFERYVVIKRIHRERVNDENAVKMFTDEARLAASLHHANIVQVHDIGEEHGEYYFAMEYVHGEDLRTILSRLATVKDKLPTEHVLTIATAVASALHYAHEACGVDRKPLNIVHRDVSPSNVIVGFDGVVKVVDFGIAKATMNANESKSGSLKGKVAYMSPEQCTSKPVDRRTDVFALGIVLWELCTVRPLFRGGSDFLTMTAITEGLAPKPSVHRPDIDPELEWIIMKALSKDPSERFQTADEMRRALEAVAASTGARTSTSALADYMVNQFGRRPEPWLIDASIDVVNPRAPTWGPDMMDESDNLVPIAGQRTAPAKPSQEQQTKVLAPGESTTAWQTDEPSIVVQPIAEAAARPKLMIGLVVAALAIAALAIVFAVGRSSRPQPAPPVYVVNENAGGSDEAIADPPPLATDAGVPVDAAVKPTSGKPPPQPASVAQRLTQVFGRQKARVAACFEKYATEITGTPQIYIRIEVGTDGKATAADLTPESVSPTPLGKCLVAIVHATQWDRQPEPVAFRIPIKLKQK